MGEFTLRQERDRTTYTVYPNANGCVTELSKYPNTGEDNYENVDDSSVENYNYNDSTPTLKDLYVFPDHSVSGEVNFVKINVRAKLQDYESDDAEYRLLMNIGDCGTEWESDDKELSPTYQRFIKTHNAIPTELGGGGWTWDDIDNIEVGIECSSPTVTAEALLRVEPSADCASCHNLLSTGNDHYTEIDEFAPDYNDYVYTEDNFIRQDSVGKGTGQIYELAYSSPTLFVATSSGISVFEVSDGVYTLIDEVLDSDLSASKVNTLWYDSSGCTLYVGIPETNQDNLFAFEWNGTTLTELGSTDLGSMTKTPSGSDCDSPPCDDGDGCDPETEYFEPLDITGDGDFIYVASYYGIQSYSFDGSTFTKEDEIEDWNPQHVDCSFEPGTCCYSSYGWRFRRIHCDSSGYIWVVLNYATGHDKPDQDNQVRVYSTNASGDFTLEDSYSNDDIRASYTPSPDDDGSYTYIASIGGRGWLNVPFIYAFEFAGGSISEVANDYQEDHEYYVDPQGLHCNNGYIYVGEFQENDDAVYQISVYSFDGSDFTHEYGSYCNPQDNPVIGEDPYIYDGQYAYRFKDIYDMYETDITPDTGTINSVKISGLIYTDGVVQEGEFLIATSCCTYDAKGWIHSGEWKRFTREWTTNPSTGTAWTWSDLNDLTIGVKLGNGDKCGDTRVAQLYAEVDYDLETNPEIRTSEVYLEIGYTPDDSTCTLNKPQEISTSHDRNVRMFNFWDGTREVYDYNRASKTMVMRGMEFVTSTCSSPRERIECVRAMGKRGTNITLSDFDMDCYNGVFKIKSFGWKLIGNKPEVYEWILEFEEAYTT